MYVVSWIIASFLFMAQCMFCLTTSWRAFGLLHFLPNMNMLHQHSCTDFCMDFCFQFSWVYIYRSRIAGACSNSMFKVLMYCQSSYTTLHSTSNVLLGVGHDLLTSLSLFTFMHWRRKWQPTPVFLPGESQGQGEPGGLPSMELHRVGHDWIDSAAAAAMFLLYWLCQSLWLCGSQ